MLLDFNQYAREGNTFIDGLASELGHPREHRHAARVFRGVLHTLRDILPARENLQLLSQLPMFLKGVYVDGWTDKPAGDIRNLDQFITRIREHTHVDGYGDNETWTRAIAVVFISLRKYVSLGELEDIKAVLPKELKSIVEPVSLL